MCGIAGVISPDANVASVAAMLAALAHRGPDGVGTTASAGAVLGHRRLAVVDLESGSQPMRSADRTATITFNGEIYGYRELRARLTSYPFATHSDTEVLLALYAEHGTSMTRYVPGMFSFAIWDEQRRRLLCARDRFGEKPFFYARGSGGEFVFASEIKGILASGLVEPVIDPWAVGRMLQRLHLPPDRTMYANVFSLAPGHQLMFERGAAITERYWALPPPGPAIELDEAAEEFRRRLERAVRRQLVADVPVGVFLSGGLDSTTVTSLASRIQPGIKSFSFDFGGAHSERAFALDAAGRYATEHFDLRAPEAGIADLLVKMCAVFDEPPLESSAIPMFLLAREARRHTTVVLTGDGGDELLGGYEWYQPLVELQGRRRAGAGEFALLRAASRVRAALGVRESPLEERRIAAAGMSRAYGTVAEAHRHQMLIFSDAEIESLGLPPQRGRPGVLAGRCVAGSVDDAMRDDLLDYMPGDILTKIDRTSMAHGLELRAPFLDVEVAEFLITLPAELKVARGESKRVLRRAFARDLPESIRTRTKQGFGPPGDRSWLRIPDVQRLAAEMLEDRGSALYDVLPFPACESFRREVREGRRWALLGMAIWLTELKRRDRSWRTTRAA